MNEQELKEMMTLLEESGVKAELCDTPIPVSTCGARCGNPTELGDECIDDYYWIPKSLAGPQPDMYIPVIGDSMIEAGYEEGDMLRVRFGVLPRDGKDMLMLIDGACTVKTFFTDEDGVKWLLPQNDEFTAFPLTEDMDVRPLGMVVKVEKDSPHHSSSSCLKAIRKAKQRMKTAKKLTEKEIDERIIMIGVLVQHARQWYAVYRALLDKGMTPEDDYVTFCDRIKRLLPEHEHLPEPKEVARMAVQSFSKPISFWTESNAPVTGSRFRDYLNIGMTMEDYLSK